MDDMGMLKIKLRNITGVAGWASFMLVLLLLSPSQMLGPSRQDHERRSAFVRITQPDGTGDVIGEGTDFATRVLRTPWDMSSPPYPDFPTVLGNIDRQTFAVHGGTWEMYTTNDDPRVNIHPTGLAEPALKVGSRFPIDASRYVLLSFRMCISQAGYAQIFWFYDQTFTKFAGSNFFPVSPDCHIYAIDLRHIGTNTLKGGATGWNGTPVGISLDPIASGSNIRVQLDWIRLTTVDLSNRFSIEWEDLDPVGATIEFYVDTDNTGYNGDKIGIVTNAPQNGTFAWGSTLLNEGNPGLPYPLPESLEPGQYYIYAKVNGEEAGYSLGPLTVDPTPVVKFLRPSFTSGRDYATTIVGDPWDMSNQEDIAGVQGITDSNFADGIFTGRTDSSGDPQVLLHTSDPIDTSQYKYLTFRMYVEGNQNIGQGWVSRLIWWNEGPTTDYVVTEDIVVYEGWQTYTLDLSKVGLEPISRGPGWTGLQRAFRLDPLEVPAPMTFHLDYAMLTAEEQVRQGTPFPVEYQVSETEGTTMNLCYDTDRDPANGRASMETYIPPSPNGPYVIHLPVVLNGYVNGDLPRQRGVIVSWDTTFVDPGTYYICAEVSDGVNTAVWYSDAPVAVVEE